MIIAFIILLFLAMLFIPGVGYIVFTLLKWALTVGMFIGVLTLLGAGAAVVGIQ